MRGNVNRFLGRGLAFEEVVEKAGGTVAHLEMARIDAGKSRAADIASYGVVVDSDDGQVLGDGDAKATTGFEEKWGDVVARSEYSNRERERFQPLFDPLGIAFPDSVLTLGDREGWNKSAALRTKGFPSLDRPAGVLDSHESEAVEAFFVEVSQSHF